MRRFLALGAMTALLGALVPVLRADPPPDRSLRYRILRNGDPIGTHEVRFQRQGPRFIVEHRIRIRVTLFALEAYRYDLDSRETWEGDRLLGLWSRTDRNGTALQVFARANGEGLRVRAGSTESMADASTVPSSPQHDVFDVPRPRMIEAEDGRMLNVRVSPPQMETLRLGSEETPCRRYRVSGDLDATLWYAPSRILVRKQLRAPDGSTVLTVLM